MIQQESDGHDDDLGFRRRPFEISLHAENIAGYHMRPPRQWTPHGVGALYDKLPRNLPDKYINLFKQPFSPHSFLVNALQLANYEPQSANEVVLISNLVSALLERLLDYSELQDDARFVVNRFDHRYRGVDLTAPWTSAYSSGAVLVGLSKWIERFDMKAYHEVAEELVKGMARIRSDAGLWVSFIDSDDYLWFEEAPLPVEPQPRILNGHVRALTGLYHWYRVSRSPLAIRLLKGGLTTVRDNVERFRVPGEVNRYDLRPPEIKDYGPQRTVVQQRELFEITGDQFFAEMSKRFAADNAAADVADQSPPTPS